jgi:acyl carrier protein
MTTPDIRGPAQIEALILGAIASFDVPTSRLGPQVRIDELGLDPLDVTELCHLLEEQCGVPVTAEDLTHCVDVEDLVVLVTVRSSSP